MSAPSFEKSLQDIVGSQNVRPDEPLVEHTTFRIGGAAQWLVLPHSEDEVAGVVSTCEAAGVPWRVLGLGSNVLAPDEGLDGVTLLLADNFAGVEVLPGALVRAAAGTTNADVAAAARDAGLAGYEFASGIPGTIGGAAIMNAGAYEGQFSDVAVEVRCLVPSEGSWRVANVPAPEAAWGYRQSRMMRESWVVLGATLQLRADSPAAIAARMEELRERRESKQPLEMPSAGSTFKRPEGHFAGALIQEAGCQGLRVGGAQVSEKHAGFVVNTGDATAADVLALIAEVQRRVHETTGVQLEPEVRLWQ
ncbi:UDP-N-acetylmuramate dehydrogenase [Adlercreutzia equolifaciens]|uniref:UDP-N-acetylenolpyruvoylglucosamine reductase n=1 Tax=Adlercreutzia equolifaciens TaxID=446660 RepID=A0A6L8Q3Q5_9ACTN|nr:UDP-N-acetylmuramate dehydrogenase [Adlercreutzia equolifaciens]MZG27919.1 UDP-N-acetylmuramate dehydrogenase [Adlercreutzia equolifaciens]HJI13126.1 UDP-N-acetylmuramate dehydrogenase [Adlercreutzia equolifaciens]